MNTNKQAVISIANYSPIFLLVWINNFIAMNQVSLNTSDFMKLLWFPEILNYFSKFVNSLTETAIIWTYWNV